MQQQYPNAYLQNSVPVRVFYQLTDSIQWPTRQGLWLSLTGFFYLCTNQTQHASDSSALCRVFSASRKVYGNPCGWFLFIYFHICKFYAI